MRLCKLIIKVIFITLFVVGCAVNVPLSVDYFQSEKKVGIIQITNDIGVSKLGSQGLIDVLLTSQEKYKVPLTIVDEEINPAIEISDMYQEIYNSNNKSLQIIDDTIDFKSIAKFQKPESDKIFYKFDLRYLKSKHNIDELLLVNVVYGLEIEYAYGLIVAARRGQCQISSEIINLDDNSLIYNHKSYSRENMKGKWNTPPTYEMLKYTIKMAIDKSIGDSFSDMYR